MTTQNKQVTINLPAPYAAQLPIVHACLSPQSKYIIVSGGRQIGKSTLGSIISIYWAQAVPSQHIMIVSKTDAQAALLQQRIMEILDSVYDLLIESAKSASGTAEITFKNKSKILFRSAGSVDGLRGYSNTHLILDECAFFSEDVYKKVLAPSMNVRGKNGKVLFLSTPCGKNYFYNLYLKGQEGNPTYQSFRINYTENPYADFFGIEQERLSSHPDIFRQEYLGEFIDASSVFHNVEELAKVKHIMMPVAGESYYAGIDVGMLKDYTVLTLINNKGEMCYMDRFTGLEAPELVNRLVQVLKIFKPVVTLIEANNQGLPIYQSMSRMYSGIVPFQTTAQSKPQIINALISAFSSKTIKVLNDEQVKLELQAFTFTQNAQGKIQFSAPSGFHDDICMSLAIAWKGYLQYNAPGRYTIMTNNNAADSFDKWINEMSKFEGDNIKGNGGGGYTFLGGDTYQ